MHLKTKNYTLNKVKENYLITYLKYPFLQNSSKIISRVHSVKTCKSNGYLARFLQDDGYLARSYKILQDNHSILTAVTMTLDDVLVIVQGY